MSKVIRGSSERALAVAEANGLTFDEAVDLMQEAQNKKDKPVSKKKAQMTFHSDGTYSAGPR